jgi:hypothetical protein
MSINRLLSLKGINGWYFFASVAINLFWTLGLSTLVYLLFLKQMQTGVAIVQLIVIVATFLGPFIIGWVVGNMAADGRGPTYGVWGTAGSVLVLALVALPTGVMGIMMIICAVAGGLNGGIMSLSRR